MLAGAALAPPLAGAATAQGTSDPRSAAMDQDAIAVQGDERLVWDQRASSPDELAGFGFHAFVNSRMQTLSSVACAAAAQSPLGFECSAALPALDPGVNVVEVAAYLATDAGREGLRSPPLYLRAGGSTAAIANQLSARAPAPPSSRDRTWTTADGVPLQATELATGLEDATDLLPLPDGRVLIAERAGRVRVFHDGALAPNGGLVLSDVVVADGSGLLALAADPAFSSTQRVFALYTTSEGLRVARYTMAGDTLVDRAILIDGLPIASARPAAILRTGPDGRLYLALDDGGDPQRLGDRGSYSGKVLRVALDGTTPADQPSPTPVWAVGVSRPVGLAWSAEAATPRLIGIESPAAATAQAQPADDAGAALTRFALTPEVGATRAAIGGGPTLPALRGNVIVASGPERAILRIRLSGDVPAVVEWLIEDLPGPATALAVAPDGGLYVAVGSTLVRIAGQ